MKVSKLLTFVVAIAFFSACSPSSPTDATAPSETPAPAAPVAAAPASHPAAPVKAAAPDRAAAPATAAKARTVIVPAGTELLVILIDSISTDKNKAGDRFMASLGAPIIVDGKTVVERGTKVQGRVADAESSGRVKGLANIRLELTGIMDGAKVIPIVTKPFVAEADSSKGRDAAVAGGGAGIGAAIGAATGGKKGAGLGAIIGGAAGTGAVLATKGRELEFGSESKLRFTLDKEVELPASKTIS